MGDRARGRGIEGGRTSVRLLVLLCLGAVLGVSVGPASAAPLTTVHADILGCNNDDAPMPASPHGPASLIVQVRKVPKDADPFTDKNVSLESVYGTTPQWVTYDNGCTGQFMAGAGTSLGNIMLELSGTLPNWSHALLHSVLAPDSWLVTLEKPVVEATGATTNSVWGPWLPVVLLAVAALVLLRSRDGQLARSVTTAAWALLVLMVTSVLIQYPTQSVRLFDEGARQVTGLIANSFNGDKAVSDSADDPAVVAIDGQFDQVVRSTQYRTWLAGTFGDPDSETAHHYGAALFRATHFSWSEQATYSQDPTGKGKDIVEAKARSFKELAATIEDSDPRAYAYLKGDHWSQRVGAAALNTVVVVVVGGYLLVAGLTILLSFALIRLIVPFAPVAGVLFMIDHTREMAIGWLHRVVGPLVMGPLCFLTALVLLRFDTAILEADIPMLIQIALVGALAWLAWRYTKPAAHAFAGVRQVGGIGLAYLMALGPHRRQASPTYPQERVPEQLTPRAITPTPTGGQTAVFMPGVTDRPSAAAIPGSRAEPLVLSGAGSPPLALPPGGAGQYPEPIGPKARRDARKEFPAPEVDHRVREPRLGPRTRFRYGSDLAPNTAYEVDGRGTFYTDDSGRVVHVNTEYGDRKFPNPDLHEPEPNVLYVVGDLHAFQTDAQGRTMEAVNPQPAPADAHRSDKIQAKIGNAAGDGYDGGHLIMNAHGGGRERINVVAQLEEMNRSGTVRFGSVPNSFYNFEKYINEQIDLGKDIYLRLYVGYADEQTKTPDMITAEFTIDGRTRRRNFPNVR